MAREPSQAKHLGRPFDGSLIYSVYERIIRIVYWFFNNASPEEYKVLFNLIDHVDECRFQVEGLVSKPRFPPFSLSGVRSECVGWAYPFITVYYDIAE